MTNFDRLPFIDCIIFSQVVSYRGKVFIPQVCRLLGPCFSPCSYKAVQKRDRQMHVLCPDHGTSVVTPRCDQAKTIKRVVYIPSLNFHARKSNILQAQRRSDGKPRIYYVNNSGWNGTEPLRFAMVSNKYLISLMCRLTSRMVSQVSQPEGVLGAFNTAHPRSLRAWETACLLSNVSQCNKQR